MTDKTNNGRTGRLKAIKKLISGNKVTSQDHLLHLLEKEGVKVTQATLSRDLKVLKVGKVPDERHGYYYVLSETEGESVKGYIEDFKRGFLTISFSGNLGVVKTLAGHADTVAIALDRLEISDILGTIAGDDTILVIIREGHRASTLLPQLEDLMGELELEE